MTTPTKDLLSNCCQSTIRVHHADEGTSFCVCDRCNKACDPELGKDTNVPTNFPAPESLPVQESWEREFDKEFVKDCGPGVQPIFIDPVGDVGPVKKFIRGLLYAQRQQAAEEATRRERARCLQCVGKLKDKIWMPKAVPIEDGDLDTIQGIVDHQLKKEVEVHKAVTASITWNLALDEIRDKIKNG